MYASEWLWAIAQPLLIPNWVAGLLGCMAFIPFYLLRVRGEEEMMRDSFGEQYEAYARKTGRIFPRLRN
jgi:protein-S-isoprenylcysteine O-methyltransferase Ste14